MNIITIATVQRKKNSGLFQNPLMFIGVVRGIGGKPVWEAGRSGP